MNVRLLLPTALVTVAFVVVSAATASLPGRLNQSQWNTYLRANNAYTAQTPKTVARFRFCRSSTKYNRNLSAFGACVGFAAAREVAVTNNLSAVLNGFE